MARATALYLSNAGARTVLVISRKASSSSMRIAQRDHLGTRYSRKTAPTISRMAAEGVCENTIAQRRRPRLPRLPS